MSDRTSHSEMRTAVFTVVSNNYLHFARTLLKSVSTHHSRAEIFCVIVDTDLGIAREFSNEFHIIGLNEIGISDIKKMSFQYHVLELNTAVKPWAIETLLNKGFDAVIYVDPDIYLYRPLEDVTKALSDHADIVVTPHLLSPMTDDKRPTELDIRRAGTYNLGFFAVRNTDNTRHFLTWWQGKLYRDCIVDHDRGIFVDQSWIDLVPGMFKNVFILRNPAYNVAYWNLAQRVVEQGVDGTWTINGEPLVFFHFSGFNPTKPDRFSKHQNRFTMSSLGPSEKLARAYAQAVIENGIDRFSKLEYGFARFSDGTPIPDPFRRLYLQNELLREKMGDDPFDRSEVLAKPAEGEGTASVVPITWCMHALHKDRPDLQSAFDLADVNGVTRFWDWIVADKNSGLSNSVREAHKRELNAFAAGTSLALPVRSADLRCHKIFADLLGRNPSQHERQRYSRLCRSRLGASVALARLSRTEESRTRPRPTRRFKKAMRSIWREQFAEAKPSAHNAVALSPDTPPHKLSGLYPPDPDSASTGVWCWREVTVPLGNHAHDVIRITGSYHPSLLRRATGRATLTLELQLDGRPWTSVSLDESGKIEIAENVPKHLAGSRSLRILADGIFIPAALGDSADQRELSWKLLKIATGDVTVFDTACTPAMLPMSQLFQPEGFNLVGYIYAELGVGEAARTMARAARAAEIPYSLVDVGYQTENRQSDRRAAAHAVDRQFPIDMLYVNADQTPNTLRYLAQKGHKPADYRIGFWHWEQPRLPEKYWGGFEGLDEVWVPTAFVQEAVSAVSPVPVFKVPHAVEFTVAPGWSRSDFGIPDEKFAVLVMYDFHSYRMRKNPEAAIAAFKIAARGRKDMTLVIKTINAAKYADDYAALKEDVAAMDSVIFIDEVYSREQIYALEASCDCMLSLHRAEGFGFGPAEMMYLGKPVIATGWSGNMEFMTPMNSFPVKYELRPLETSLGAYQAGLDWAEPDVEHAADCLTRLIEREDLARAIGERARETMLTKYSPDVIGRQYRERLTVISARL